MCISFKWKSIEYNFWLQNKDVTSTCTIEAIIVVPGNILNNMSTQVAFLSEKLYIFQIPEHISRFTF